MFLQTILREVFHFVIKPVFQKSLSGKPGNKLPSLLIGMVSALMHLLTDAGKGSPAYAVFAVVFVVLFCCLVVLVYVAQECKTSQNE